MKSTGAPKHNQVTIYIHKDSNDYHHYKSYWLCKGQFPVVGLWVSFVNMIIFQQGFKYRCQVGMLITHWHGTCRAMPAHMLHCDLTNKNKKISFVIKEYFKRFFFFGKRVKQVTRQTAWDACIGQTQCMMTSADWHLKPRISRSYGDNVMRLISDHSGGMIWQNFNIYCHHETDLTHPEQLNHKI